jgi:hypothetical protein
MEGDVRASSGVGGKMFRGYRKSKATGIQEQPRQKNTFLYWHDEHDEPAKEEPLSYVLLGSLFASVSTSVADP